MSDLNEKLKLLLSELADNSSRELRLARWSHWFNTGAMVAALVTTAAAVAYGLIPDHSSQITAALALLSGGLALLATSVKFQARCDWQY